MTHAFFHPGSSEAPSALAALFNPQDPASLRQVAVLDGRMVGRIVTDNPAAPRWAVLQERAFGTLYLGGAIDAALVQDIIALLRLDGDVLVGLWPDDPRRGVLPSDPDYVGSTCEFYDRRGDGARLAALVRRLPEGCHVRPIDRTLIARCAWRDQQQAIYGSLDAFCAHGLGYCVLRGEDILSEAYAGPAVRGMMEIGIYTHPAHRGHGYATIACAQAVAACEARGYKTYWNCDTSNQASVALARTLGYQTQKEYTLLAWSHRAGESGSVATNGTLWVPAGEVPSGTPAARNRCPDGGPQGGDGRELSLGWP